MALTPQLRVLVATTPADFRCGIDGLARRVRQVLAGTLPTVQPVTLVAVRGPPKEGLYDHLIAQYHYLGPAHGVGEQLKYLAFSQARPVAALGFTSAPRHLAPRDRFIGWSPAVRRAHVHELAYNTRFLILPWVRVPHLASHLLGQVARRIAAHGDWRSEIR